MRKNRIRPGGPFIKAPILAAGDDLTVKRAALVMPTPAYRQNGVIDVMPSLLLSTLAATVIALPIGERSTDLAPRAPPKIQVQAEQQEPSPLQRGIVGTIPAKPSAANLFSPQQHYAVTFEHPPNLLRKLLPDFAPVGIRASDSAPIVKYAVEADNWPSQLTTGIPAAAPVPIPLGRQVGDSSPPKYAVQAQQYPTLIRVTLPDFAPVGIQLQDHETKSKYEVVALTTPNLTQTTLAPSAAALPQGNQLSSSAPTIYSHGVVQVDDFQSLLALNPPPPPIPVGPTTVVQPPAGKHKRLRYYVEIDDQQFQVDSPQEALSILLKAKEFAPISAERAAKLVLRKQLKRKRRPQINLKPPSIETNAPITEQLVAIRSDIEAIYQDVAITQELAYLFKKQLQIEQDDEEDVILLLH